MWTVRSNESNGVTIANGQFDLEMSWDTANALIKALQEVEDAGLDLDLLSAPDDLDLPPQFVAIDYMHDEATLRVMIDLEPTISGPGIRMSDECTWFDVAFSDADSLLEQLKSVMW